MIKIQKGKHIFLVILWSPTLPLGPVLCHHGRGTCWPKVQPFESRGDMLPTCHQHVIDMLLTFPAKINIWLTHALLLNTLGRGGSLTVGLKVVVIDDGLKVGYGMWLETSDQLLILEMKSLLTYQWHALQLASLKGSLSLACRGHLSGSGVFHRFIWRHVSWSLCRRHQSGCQAWLLGIG